MRTPLAQAVSAAGHPVILMPVAAGLSAAAAGASAELARTIWTAAGALAVAVVLFSAVQVWRGRWTDSDASVPEERSELNLFLAPLLAGGAVWAGWSGQPLALVCGLGLAAGVIALALLTARWLKLSLHTAFAVFGASLFWPQALLVAVGLGLAALIGWARLHLRRHSLPDVFAGAAAGLVAGTVLQATLSAP